MIRGFTCSAFDLLHTGHLLFLEACKENCDELIVALHVNPNLERADKNKPIQSLFERQIQLAGCKYVDQIIAYETEEELENILKSYSFDKRFVGSDYLDEDKSITGKELCKIHYISRNHPYSSSELRKRIKKS